MKKIVNICFAFMIIFNASCQTKSDNVNISQDSIVVNKKTTEVVTEKKKKTVNWFEINSFNKVVSFSKVAKPGKISVFLVSTDWCAPCLKLKKQLYETDFNNQIVDFYYVSVSGGHSYSELKETSAYVMWRFFERMEEWPTILIYSPTTNLIKKFNHSILKEESYPKGCYEKTVEIIERLSEYREKYYSMQIIDGKSKEIKKMKSK